MSTQDISHALLDAVDPDRQLEAALGEGSEDTRRRVPLQELLPEPDEKPPTERVLQTLADAHLVTTGKNEVEVAHEALIREWPTLQRWLDENREGLRIHRRLGEAAKE